MCTTILLMIVGNMKDSVILHRQSAQPEHKQWKNIV